MGWTTPSSWGNPRQKVGVLNKYKLKLIRAKCTRLNLDEAKTTAAEFRTLSVYLQRGNGRILINRDIQYGEEPLNDVINDI